jgi:hypothetical protein
LITAKINHSVAPILLLAKQKNFGLYMSEIMKTEGFNGVELDSLANKQINTAYLDKFRLIILAEQDIDENKFSLLDKYVKTGGKLIAIDPPKALDKLCGIHRTGEMLHSFYVVVDSTNVIANGITPKPMQLHVPANQTTLSAAKTIASFVSSIKSSYPALIENDYGKGQVISFLYNLPQNIIYTRQGNPADAAKEKDGITGIRAMDLFTDGWVDTSLNCINQADEQMRLLTHCIERMMDNQMPLPRTWYFPNQLKSLVTLNNDGEDSKEEEFNAQFGDVDAKGAKMSLYIKETDLISGEWTDKWQAKGFEIAGHPDDTKQATAPDWTTMDSVYKNLLNRLRIKYGITAMHTVVNHWFVWCGKNEAGEPDFTAQAKLEAKYGVQLDANYAHYDNGSGATHFLGTAGNSQGNYTGSGLAMKFCDEEGSVVNIFQHLNNVYDQQYMEHKDSNGFFQCFKGLIDRSLSNEVYSLVSIKAHNNEYFFSKTPLAQMLDYAAQKNIPVWTERKLLDFLRAREAIHFTTMQWRNNQLSFEIDSPVTFEEQVTCMVPARHRALKVSNILIDGNRMPYEVRTIKGVQYALFNTQPGSNHLVSVNY